MAGQLKYVFWFYSICKSPAEVSALEINSRAEESWGEVGGHRTRKLTF